MMLLKQSINLFFKIICGKWQRNLANAVNRVDDFYLKFAA